jgi:hypothetical protein
MGRGSGRAALVLAHRSWQERVKEEKKTNLHVMKMLKRLLICSLRQSFDVWLSHIFEKQQHTAEALNAAWRHMKSAHAKVHTRQKHIEWRTRLELLQKFHLAFVANTFAHWMNGKMNSGTSAAHCCTSRLCLELTDSSTSAAHSGTSRLGESTEKLLKLWPNVTCIQTLEAMVRAHHRAEHASLVINVATRSIHQQYSKEAPTLRRWRGTCGVGRYDAGESRRSSRWAGQIGRVYKP